MPTAAQDWPPDGEFILWDGTSPAIDESRASTVLRVIPPVDDPSATQDVAADGSEARPFQSIGQAMTAALAQKAQGVGVKISIASGTYRETIIEEDFKNPAEDTDAPLVIEAERPGTVTVTGADRWTDGWRAGEQAGVYLHDWPHKWGVPANPWANFDDKSVNQTLNVDFPEIVRRAEIVLLDGRPLRQVLDRDDLKEGGFHIDEAAETLTVHLPPQRRPDELEVGVRNTLFAASGKRNLVIRGIRFQHCANGFNRGAALSITNSENVLIEDCQTEWNNYSGFTISGARSKHTTLRRVRANHNGYGNGSAQTTHLRLEDVEASHNNWRGDWGGWHGWDVAGIKILDTHHAVVTGYRAVDNKCDGLWFDWANADITIDKAFIAGNHNGMFLEISQGPIMVKNSVLAHNRDAGIFTASCNDVTIDGTTFYGNGLGFSVGHWEDREVTDFRTGWKKVMRAEGYAIRDCIFDAGEQGGPLLDVPNWEHFLTTIRSARNLWHPRENTGGFRIGGLEYGFDDWQRITGQDGDSLAADPKWANPAANDFTPSAESPLHTRATWPKRELTPEGLAFAYARRGELVKRSWLSPMPMLIDAAAPRFETIDLRAHANRALVNEGGAWIGIPNPYLTPGKHEFHGVPFSVIDQAENDRRSIVALPSKRVEFTVDGSPLPNRTEVSIEGTARGVYVLHGAGYVTSHGTAARYTILYADGSSAPAVEIVAFGPSSGQAGPDEARREVSAVQDWWSTFPQFENDFAKSVALLSPDDPAAPPVYLYVMEWRNPHPDRPLRALVLESDGTRDASVLVAAVTVLQ